MIARALERFFDWRHATTLLVWVIACGLMLHMINAQSSIVDAHQEERATRKQLIECLQREATP